VGTVKEESPFCEVTPSKCCIQEIGLFVKVTASKTQRHSREAASRSANEDILSPTEPEGSLPCSQQPATATYFELINAALGSTFFKTVLARDM